MVEDKIIEITEINIKKGSSNFIAGTLKVIGALTLIAGFFAGTFENTIIYWAASFISSVIFFGFGEIISLLQELVSTEKVYKYKFGSDLYADEVKKFDDLPPL